MFKITRTTFRTWYFKTNKTSSLKVLINFEEQIKETPFVNLSSFTILLILLFINGAKYGFKTVFKQTLVVSYCNYKLIFIYTMHMNLEC